jgi:hypothetical protein
MPKRLYHYGQRMGTEGIKICLNLPGLLDLVLLIGGEEVASSVSGIIALFPFFAPAMLERVWSKIFDLSLSGRY